MPTRDDERAGLSNLVDIFAHHLKARLFIMIDLGKTGWDDPETRQELKKDLLADVEAIVIGDAEKEIDSAARAMMIWRLRGIEEGWFDEAVGEVFPDARV